MPFDGESDEILAARCQKGDYEAFGELFERYQKPIMAYIYQIVHNADDAACVAQDVFLKVFEKVGSFDTNRRFSTWFYTVARNAAIDHLHAQHRRAIVSFGDLDAEDGEAAAMALTASPDTSPSVSRSLESTEAASLLRKAIAQLPQIYREIVELIIFQDLSYEDASQILGGISLGTLRSRMFHALRQLRATLIKVGGAKGENLL